LGALNLFLGPTLRDPEDAIDNHDLLMGSQLGDESQASWTRAEAIESRKFETRDPLCTGDGSVHSPRWMAEGPSGQAVRRRSPLHWTRFPENGMVLKINWNRPNGRWKNFKRDRQERQER